jgi:hypothetical protein
MLASLARLATLALVLAAGPARADELSDFNTAVEAAAAHNRVAIGYLRTGNTDLASLEIDRLRAAWARVGERKRPAVFAGNALYVTVMTDIAMRLVTADMMLNSDRADAARQSLVGIRDGLYDLRKSAGIVVLADCVRDANALMDALMVYNDRALDWGKGNTAADIAGKAARYSQTLTRCDATADDKVRKEPEFRRLIDGAQASLALIPKAVAERDSNLLHRVLIELRSFDNLLAFRFG